MNFWEQVLALSIGVAIGLALIAVGWVWHALATPKDGE